MVSKCCKVELAIIFPPLAVFTESGCGCDLLINVCLTCLGFIPGIIHAMCVIFSKGENDHHHSDDDDDVLNSLEKP
jgi:uncharacterized membrane protein YqaE (UPF0057 family)